MVWGFIFAGFSVGWGEFGSSGGLTRVGGGRGAGIGGVSAGGKVPVFGPKSIKYERKVSGFEG